MGMIGIGQAHTREGMPKRHGSLQGGGVCMSPPQISAISRGHHIRTAQRHVVLFLVLYAVLTSSSAGTCDQSRALLAVILLIVVGPTCVGDSHEGMAVVL